MSTLDESLRDSDDTLLKSICRALVTKGRLDALVKHGQIDPEERKGLEQLKGKEKQEALKQALKKLKYLRGLWEGYHVIHFAAEIRTDVGKENIEKALDRHGVSKKFEWIQRIPTEQTVSLQKARKLFEAFADAQGKSLLLCLVEFLDFCKKHSYPLAIFVNREQGLEDTIRDIRHYLGAIQEKKATIDSVYEPKTPPSGNDHDGLSIRFDDDGNCTIGETSGVEVEDLRIPNDEFSLRLSSVASLLDWQCHLTPFMGRKQEITQLDDWLVSAPQRSIKLIYGEGGVGKSRLAFYFAQEISGPDWSAGQPATGIEGNWRLGRKGMLLIIDYPEERAHRVTRLVRAMKDMPSIEPRKLCVLLISRNRQFFDALTADAPRYVEASMPLPSLNTEDEQWDLMEAAWRSLHDLQARSAHQEFVDSPKSTPSVNKAALTAWLQQLANPTPLMIIALAVYLFGEKDTTTPLPAKLEYNEIVRRLSEREATRISNEVEAVRKAKGFGDKLKPQGVLLTKAVAAITDGMDDKSIRMLFDDLRQQELSSPPPEVEYLCELSLWENKELVALKPDILAADFLAYCLEKWAANHEADWIFAAIGLSRTQDAEAVDDQELLGNFARLGRLIFDAKVQLKQT